MIRRVVLRRFKRFQEVAFDLPGPIVLAGPNNCGKTTVLQAISAWSVAFNRWREGSGQHRTKSRVPARVPIARQAFTAVPLRAFDLLWHERDCQGSIEIEIQGQRGWTVAMELIPDTSEQIYVRPKPGTAGTALREADVPVVYVPPMTGLSVGEPVYQKPKVDQLLGLGKPGEIIRNLLVEAHGSQKAWEALQASIRDLFGLEMIPPDAAGADIVADYRKAGTENPRFDIASAGSGFQQVLMLLSFLHARPASILLVDEPDAHLHVILQDAIYGELRAVAARNDSQLIVATHSEVIVNSADPSEIYVLLDQPRILATPEERERLADALRMLSQVDLMLARTAPGILYVDGRTDIDILRAWARVLGHPACETLTTKAIWKPSVWEPRPGALGIRAKDHYEALRLVREDLPGLILIDGDDDARVPETPITGQGLQRARWRRYEIESYLVHPAALERFAEKMVGPGEASAQARKDMRRYLEDTLGPEFLADPLKPRPLVDTYFRSTKARTDVIPPILDAAGLPGFPYTRYQEIAALMRPGEIHPEVREKLDAIQKAFRL